MDKTLLTVIAALGAIAPLSTASADVSPIELDRARQASSFAELLQPISNAAAILAVVDDPNAVSPDAEVQTAQYHHHHHHYRRYYHHHHHHYHHHHHHYY